MLRVNKKMEYGILALLHLAMEPEQVASVREIANACHIPEPLLGKVMQSLKRSALVASAQGHQGGYRLSRKLEAISLLDLQHSLVGPIHVTECSEPGSQCPVESHCTIAVPMRRLNERLVDLFQSTSLEQLAGRKAV